MNPVFYKRQALPLLLYGMAAACCYSFFVSIFLRSNDQAAAWWLYIGNVSFMMSIFVYTISQQKKAATVIDLLIAGNICTLAGILISIIIIYILYITLSKQVLKESTVMVMINCIIGNFSTGSFIALLTTNAANRNEGNNTGTKG